MEPEHGAPTVLGAAVANYGGGSGGGARQGCLRGGQAPRSLHLSGLKGVQPPLPFGERTRDCSPGHAGEEGPQPSA